MDPFVSIVNSSLVYNRSRDGTVPSMELWDIYGTVPSMKPKQSSKAAPLLWIASAYVLREAGSIIA